MTDNLVVIQFPRISNHASAAKFPILDEHCRSFRPLAFAAAWVGIVPSHLDQNLKHAIGYLRSPESGNCYITGVLVASLPVNACQWTPWNTRMRRHRRR